MEIEAEGGELWMLRQPVFWIGGSACAGKSTLAGMYADKYGMTLYSCDEHFNDHLKRIPIGQQSVMSQVTRLTVNEVFLTREVGEQLDTYIKCFQEDFSFVLDDLACMGANPVVVEGNQLLPALVAPLLKKKDRAIWIVPAEQFQWEHYRKRDWIHGILQETDNPEMAFCNWMRRDALFAERVKQEAAGLRLSLLEVDGSTTLQQNFELMEKYFNS